MRRDVCHLFARKKTATSIPYKSRDVTKIGVKFLATFCTFNVQPLRVVVRFDSIQLNLQLSTTSVNRDAVAIVCSQLWASGTKRNVVVHRNSNSNSGSSNNISTVCLLSVSPSPSTSEQQQHCAGRLYSAMLSSFYIRLLLYYIKKAKSRKPSRVVTTTLLVCIL